MCAYFFHVESRTQHLNHTSKPFFFLKHPIMCKAHKKSIYVHRDGNIEMITLHIQGPFKPLKNLFCCYLRTMMIRLSIFRYMCMLFLFLCVRLLLLARCLPSHSFIHSLERPILFSIWFHEHFDFPVATTATGVGGGATHIGYPFYLRSSGVTFSKAEQFFGFEIRSNLWSTPIERPYQTRKPKEN